MDRFLTYYNYDNQNERLKKAYEPNNFYRDDLFKQLKERNSIFAQYKTVTGSPIKNVSSLGQQKLYCIS